MWGEINGEKPFEWRETFRLERNLSIGPSWSFCVIGIMKSAEECWTQFSCNNCIHPFKAFMLSTKVKEDATKNHKFHIPFSWIKFHHIDIFHLIMKALLYTKIYNMYWFQMFDHWPQCPSCNNAISIIKSQSLKTHNVTQLKIILSFSTSNDAFFHIRQ